MLRKRSYNCHSPTRSAKVFTSSLLVVEEKYSQTSFYQSVYKPYTDSTVNLCDPQERFFKKSKSELPK